MSKVYYILEHKPVIYTYKVYARNKAEAMRKYNSNENYEEIGLEPGKGIVTITVSEMGEASDTCAVCGIVYSPDNVGDYCCQKCHKNRANETR